MHVVPRQPVADLPEAVEVAERLGWDVVLKATAPAVRGRPDLASVHRNISSPEEMAEAWRDLARLVAELGYPGQDDLSVAVPVGEATADALVAKLKPRVSALKVGPASDAGAEMGPLTALLRWGARVAAVDLPRPALWQRVHDTARRGAGSSTSPHW